MSDEVSQFLEQVGRLREQQIEDDEARAREREEFLAAKRERQARREERARSISPQKSSPLNTPSPRSNRQSVHASDATRFGSPGVTVHDREPSASPLPGLDNPMPSPTRPDKEKETCTGEKPTHKESSTPTARTSTLSWQRRPVSRGGARPLSMVAAQNATQRSIADTQGPSSSTIEENLSKDQIAKASGSKQSSWFGHTAGDGRESAAYRQNQAESDHQLDILSVKDQLSIMSVADSISKDGSCTKSSVTEIEPSKLASPVTFRSPLFDGGSEESHQALDSTMTSGKASPNRSPSPTKGLGGFVQSAMMKRSDSVKRWSVTSPPGLTRADSVAAKRGSYDKSFAHTKARPQNTTQGSSTTPTSSRPTSRHEDNPSELGDVSKSSSQGSMASTGQEDVGDDENASVPSSPSKTMDPRRWSPTKSSWLESALNRPESPRLTPSPTQSTWREKAVMDSNRPTSVLHKHQVSIGGLMRQSALGNVAKSNPTGLGGIYSPPPNANRPAYGHVPKPTTTQKQLDTEPSDSEPVTQLEKVENSFEQPTRGESAKRTPAMSPPAVKPKPQTPPPTKDLRSNLRQRPVEKETSKINEPEFKNVFGNLRRTKTKNYVATDELKNNILRGKAGLHVTDGPRKSERKDDFKDAILKKRADFKTAQVEGRGVTRTPSNTAEQAIPEGLAKRAELGKAIATAIKKNSPSETLVSAFVKKDNPPKPTAGLKSVPGGTAFSPRSPNTAQPPPHLRSPSTEKLKHVSTEPLASKLKTELQPPPSLQQDSSAPSKLPSQGRVAAGGSKLGARFNPALAELLARGPPNTSVNGGRSSDDHREPVKTHTGVSTESSGPGPQLTHMTKNRARGPKRKAPTSAATCTGNPTSVIAATKSIFASKLEETLEAGEVKHEGIARLPQACKTNGEPLNKSQLKSFGLSIQEHVVSNAAPRGDVPTAPEPGPVKPVQPIEPAAQIRPGCRGRSQSMSRKSTSHPHTRTNSQNESEAVPLSSPKKLDLKRVSRFLDESSSQKAENESVKEPIRLSHQRTGSRSPNKLAEPPSPTKSDRDSLPSMRDREASPRLDVRSPPTSKSCFDQPTTPLGLKRSSRPLSSLSGEGFKSPPVMSSPTRSPTKQANEVSALLSDFFSLPQTRKSMKIDPAQILMNRPRTGDKVTSLGLQMFRILDDGKKLPVSTQNERVLFDHEMYVCAHNFANRSGNREFEVYFWVGDEVPESSAEDAQLFVQREARALGGNLVKLRQGKETTEFVQALGGIMIVRRGSSNKYDSLSPSMLCGRRYLGQVVFDEVDFSPSNLCAGFTYLLSRGGNCYMWKGKGSDVTEVSCARLVGMDLTLTGELIEYEDGSEPAHFWDIFEDKSSKPYSADHWRLKPSYEQYNSRLFCSDADSRQQIFEISPFNQADLSSASIYILDAFFEIYIIIGSGTKSQYSSFRNALDFAQEYAILASGMEDRPFVPISTVVLEGIPRDLKRVFRKWDDGKNPTVTNILGSESGLKRGRSLRVVTLTQALQALAE